MGLLEIISSYTEPLNQVDRKVFPVYISHKQFIETSLPPSSLRIFGLEHMNSLVSLQCTAAESQTSIYLLGPQSQSPCEPV